MSQFPKNRPEIIDLAQKVLNGFTSHPDTFPNQPLDLEAYRSNIQKNYIVYDRVATLRAALEEAIQEAEDSTSLIGDQTRTGVRYAENLDLTEQQLALIGWGNRATPAPQAVPGQTRNLEILSEARRDL